MISKLAFGLAVLASFADAKMPTHSLLSLKVAESGSPYVDGYFYGYSIGMNSSSIGELDPEFQGLIGFFDGYADGKDEFEESYDYAEKDDKEDNDCDYSKFDGYYEEYCPYSFCTYWEQGFVKCEYNDGSTSSSNPDGSWDFRAPDGSYVEGDFFGTEYYNKTSGDYYYVSSEGDNYAANYFTGEYSYSMADGSYGYGNEEYKVEVDAEGNSSYNAIDGSYGYSSKGYSYNFNGSDGSFSYYSVDGWGYGNQDFWESHDNEGNCWWGKSSGEYGTCDDEGNYYLATDSEDN